MVACLPYHLHVDDSCLVFYLLAAGSLQHTVSLQTEPFQMFNLNQSHGSVFRFHPTGSQAYSELGGRSVLYRLVSQLTSLGGCGRHNNETAAG